MSFGLRCLRTCPRSPELSFGRPRCRPRLLFARRAALIAEGHADGESFPWFVDLVALFAYIMKAYEPSARACEGLPDPRVTGPAAGHTLLLRKAARKGAVYT